MKKYIYSEFTERMSTHARNNTNLPPLVGYIVFSESNWNKIYPFESRTYEVQSDANYYNAVKIGNSLFGHSIDLQDTGVRLDHYIHEEHWKIDYCYFKENTE